MSVSDLPEGEVLSYVVHEYAATTHKLSNQGGCVLVICLCAPGQPEWKDQGGDA